MSFEHITYEVTDPVATITLNRPEFYNAFTPTMGRELRDAFGRAERDPAVVGIVLTGAGKGFCAGADMKNLQSLGDRPGSGNLAEPDPADDMPGDPSWGDDLRGTHTFMMSIPKPVIGAINGAVAGMGLPIALACDLRFMNESAVVSTAFAQRGLIAEWGLAWLLDQLVGPSRALDLLLSSRRVSGTECAAMGLVNRALPADQVLPEAQAYVENLARTVSPSSMATIKRQVYQGLTQRMGEHERESIELMKGTLNGADFREGVASFLEKRDPQFARLEIDDRS